MNPFNWRLVLVQVVFGLVFAGLTITASISGVSATKWVALALLATIGLIVGLRAANRPFRHGLAAGFMAGLVAVWTQALFANTYFANNPEYAEIEIPFGLSARTFTILFAPVNAVIAGVIAGFVAWLVFKALRSRAI